jgi:hypothetical protein
VDVVVVGGGGGGSFVVVVSKIHPGPLHTISQFLISSSCCSCLWVPQSTTHVHVSADVVAAASVVTASVVSGVSVVSGISLQFVQTISHALKSSFGANARVPQSTTHTQFSLTFVFVWVVGAVVGVVVGSQPSPTQSRVQAEFRSTSSD